MDICRRCCHGCDVEAGTLERWWWRWGRVWDGGRRGNGYWGMLNARGERLREAMVAQSMA